MQGRVPCDTRAQGEVQRQSWGDRKSCDREVASPVAPVASGPPKCASSGPQTPPNSPRDETSGAARPSLPSTLGPRGLRPPCFGMPRMFPAATDPSAMTTGGRGQGAKGTQGNSAGGGDSAPQGLGPKQERAADPSGLPRSKAWERHKLVSGGRPVLTPQGQQSLPQGRRGRPVLRESHLTRSSCDADMPPFKSWGSVPPPACLAGPVTLEAGLYVTS